jgi:hypothetical protein
MCLFGIAGDVFHRGHDLAVRPAGGELGLAGPSGTVPVPTAGRSSTITVEDVSATLGRDANGVQVRPVWMIAYFDRLPSEGRRSFRLGVGLSACVRPLVTAPDDLCR